MNISEQCKPFAAYRSHEVRSTALYTGLEVEALLPAVGMIDVRQLGCPDEIFEFVLEERMKKAGIKIERRDVPGADTDLERRVREAKPF